DLSEPEQSHLINGDRRLSVEACTAGLVEVKRFLGQHRAGHTARQAILNAELAIEQRLCVAATQLARDDRRADDDTQEREGESLQCSRSTQEAACTTSSFALARPSFFLMWSR